MTSFLALFPLYLEIQLTLLLAPTGALYTKNALFFKDVSNFFKNGLKWLGYMYIKGFGAELASYRNLKSNRVSGIISIPQPQDHQENNAKRRRKLKLNEIPL